ncbi:MAG: hypothetical protein ACRBBN_07705 [Methyloligellaceae bacterium]
MAFGTGIKKNVPVWSRERIILNQKGDEVLVFISAIMNSYKKTLDLRGHPRIGNYYMKGIELDEFM